VRFQLQRVGTCTGAHCAASRRSARWLKWRSREPLRESEAVTREKVHHLYLLAQASNSCVLEFRRPLEPAVLEFVK
jgi:hypothetical protein